MTYEAHLSPPPARGTKRGKNEAVDAFGGVVGVILLGVVGTAMLLGCGAGSSSADASPSPAREAAMANAAPSPKPTPATRTKLVTVTQSIPYPVKKVNDSSLAKGTTRVKTAGVNGVKTLTYEVTLVDGVESGRSLVKEAVTKAPVTKVILVGTKQTSTTTRKCDPNYSGCVPIASDVDCAGGSGNGPAYVQGPVRIIGRDIYDLDGNDNDGIGCE
ncbi:G5 domain-containing protein [Catellatospora tritici]|uniref:G5 domain-containing protein n=1 Tax=Catellatospora tritici TaxID=2851566 RepID=UPI001C2DD00B|nr:G5 domain-containing protein [Catellatospora tritici]MBV1849204.1 G5 domain-containing protein [Catellatospora tritici]